MAITRVAVTAVLLVLCWSTHRAKAQEVTITADYTRPPDFPFPPGSNEYRAASGPLTFTCLVDGAAASGVAWTSDCDCPLASSATNPIIRFALTSGDTGTHTCAVGGGSANIMVNIVGAGIYIFRGRSSTSNSIEDFNLPNNGLVVSTTETSGFRFRIFCRSDSMMENVGDFIGLDGSSVSTGGPFLVQRSQAGEITVENRASDDVLDATQQGVYTCLIPDAANITREINVGVYTSTFNVMPTIPNPLVFTPGPSSSTLNCTSTGSPATTVTFTRNTEPSFTLRDGEEETDANGVTYRLAQTVRNRQEATYDNVLTINQTLDDIFDSMFTCSVENTIGSSPESQPLTIMAIEITSPPQPVTVGESATFTCTSLLGMADMIQWFLVDGTSETQQRMNMGQEALDLVLNPVSQSMDGNMYRCRVTIGGSDMDRDVTVTVQVPDVTVDITTAGSAEVGMSYTLTCTVSGADNLGGADIAWAGPSGVTGSGTSLQLPLGTLDLNDAGQYTCTATVTSNLLNSDLVRMDTEDVILQIPSPSISVADDGGSTIYAGSVLTLACEIFLMNVPLSLRDGVTVMTAWTGAMGNPLVSGGLITVNPAVGTAPTYTSTVVFNTVRTGNNGTYTCQATVAHSSGFITSVTTPSQVTISVQNPPLVLSVTFSTNRLPNVSPYNTFTLTCMATAPEGVVEEKTLTWRRTSGSEGTCGSFLQVTSGGMFQIMPSDLDQPVSTSVLTVTETVAAMWRYCCQATLLGASGTSNERLITVTGPAPPEQPTNLLNVDTLGTSTTIQWTVPIIAYTPETYVVKYGTNMGSLDMMSDPIPGGSDFELEDEVLSGQLTGLTDTTTYHYQVVATNSLPGVQGTTSSTIQSFTTTILRPGPPRNFVVTVSTATSLSFSWVPPEARVGLSVITRYIVRCEPRPMEFDTPAPVNQSATLPLTATVSDLSPGVNYTCNVSAMNDRGEGERTEESGTTQETAPGGAPQNLNIVRGADGDTSRQLMFSWDPPPITLRNGVISSYIIFCSSDAESSPVSETVMPPDISRTVGGFRPFTNYTCMINATTSQGVGPAASETTTTNEDNPDGSPLFPSFATTDTPGNLTFTVQPPEVGLRNGIIRSYSVRCLPTDVFRVLTAVTGTIDSESGVVGGFIAAAEYTCFFTAFTKSNLGPGPETVDGLSVITLPAAPEITSVMNLSSSEVLVEWVINVPGIDDTDEPGAITRYTIYVDDNQGVNTADGTVLSYTIRNLDPYQLVTVQVSASTSAGEGARSAAETGRSSEAPSGPVSNILWNPQSASSVTISWTQPERPNGDILSYSVVLERYVGGVVGTVDVDGNTLIASFSGTQDNPIVAETPYNVTVTARNSAGEGDPVEIVNFTVVSRSPPPPRDVSITRSTDGRSIAISWTPLTIVEAGSFIDIYRVSYSPTSSRRKRQSGTTCSQSPCDVPSTESGASIIGLDPAINYGVRVSTVSTEGESGMTTDPLTSEGVSSSSFPAGIVGGVVGGVLGGIAIVLLIILICYCVRCKKQSKYTPYSGDYGMEAKQEKTKPQPLAETATKSFMQSEEDLATFEPSKTPVAITDSQAVERLRAIAVSAFTQHVLEMHHDRDKYFELEYQSISNEPLASYDIAKLPYNKAKNRFANIFPYDFCRVKLQEIEGVEGSDYVNASYVDGYNHPNAYVAAQGPLPNTVTDFWRMVWEHRLNTIVMLTKTVEAGKRKCEQYWPDNVNENFEPPNSTIVATLTSVMPFADYEIKTFLVKDNAHPDVPPLKVMHYHFLGWPDHGVPKFATSLIAFIRRVRKEHNKDGPPMLVHCSAGVGRTGTYILLDSMLERMKAEETVNVYEYLRNMRAKRVFMVQTLAQYTFIHDALNELITCGDTSIAASNLRVKINRLHKVLPGKAIPGFEDQFQLLDHVSRKPVGNDCSDAVQPYNKAKNRYLDRLPYNLSRARLRPTGATGAEYINASFVDGYKQRNTYIAVQAPLQETVSDFWRMIWEFKSKAIVMLCSAEENGQETSYPYWSMRVGEPEIFGKLQITLASEEPTKDFVIRKFEVKEDKVGQGGPPGFMVTQFHVTQWPEQGRPPSSNIVLGLIDQLIKVQRGTGNRSITVMCNDGMGRTGTFIAIHAQLERVKTEGVVDFFQFIKSSRIHRPYLVSGLEHYIFCHDALADYLDSFDTYANFKDFGSK